MGQIDQGFGKLNLQAPSALSHFAFLIGRWTCEARLKTTDRSWQVFRATWLGRFILDGYAIEDEYRMTDATGELIVLGMNVRTYDPTKRAWNIRWLNALAGSWTDLASEELGGVSIDDHSIRYSFREPVAAQAYTRATYLDISAGHFTWLGESSDDGQTWTDFMVVECYRSEG